MPSLGDTGNERSQRGGNLAAGLIALLGLLARLWTASGTFLNPDEALHFRLANQVSLGLAYRAGLTASHPPLLTFLLHFWRVPDNSELWLRLPSVLAGPVFCWMFYKWLAKAAGELAGLIGLLFVALLPPVVQIGAEVRQYALLLAFLASALYFLDEAFAKNSSRDMAVFSLFLYLAMLSHYSAFLFAAALGIYAVIRMFTQHSPRHLLAVWAMGQLVGLALAAFLYKTHISKLGVGESRTVLQGWMSEFYLHHSYFDPTRDNPFIFLLGHSFGVFQYFFGQLAVGDVMGLLFVVGVVPLLREKSSSADRDRSRQLAVLLLFPFAIAAVAGLAHIYPYGGTRHVAFLIIPGTAGVAVAMARLAAGRWGRGLTIAALVIVVCVALGRPRRPRMDRADQSRTQMAAAMKFIRQNINPSDVIFTDYESDLVLGHYLCQQLPISFEASIPDFEVFSCGHRVVSASYRDATIFAPDNFVNLWERLVQTYRLKPGNVVWIFQAGWEVKLPEKLRSEFAQFRDLRFESFGNNIKLFKLTVGQPMPGSSSSFPVEFSKLRLSAPPAYSAAMRRE
ncbi:MAG: glycosyltransferase family 39 protein [Candidatus Sulfotelmatobacter sp.]